MAIVILGSALHPGSVRSDVAFDIAGVDTRQPSTTTGETRDRATVDMRVFSEPPGVVLALQDDAPPKPDAATARQAPDPDRLPAHADAVSGKAGACWIPPVGARNPKDMVIEVRLSLDRDGTVRQVEILEPDRVARDPYLRELVDSALQALRDPRCNTFELPPEKHETWKDMILRFDASEAAGQ